MLVQKQLVTVLFTLQNKCLMRGENFNGKTAVVSGAGNVAIYAIEKLQNLGAKAVTCS